ncbi:MAG TPA: ABC transporter permease [Alloacidobacterium sp.]|nr:ABC transporter permease [Alloacidobacterium sp.]
MRLFRRRIYKDLSEEIRQHLEEKIDMLMADGMSREDAEHHARREFGNVALLEERGREAWQWPEMRSLWADVKFGLRQIRRYRTFTLMAVLTLALGIGTNTAIFTLLDSIVLRPLPFEQQDRLASIEAVGLFPKGWIKALQDHSQSFASIAAYGANEESNVSSSDVADRVFGTRATVNIFDTLGIHPALGRFFEPEDAIYGRDQVAIISYGYWQQHFARSPQALGQSLRIDGVDRRIIGVMPANIHFPYADTQFITPVSYKGGDPLDPWQQPYDLHALGRLKDGVSPAAAQAELRRLHPQLLPLFPWRMPDVWGSDAVVTPLLDSIVGNTRPRLLLLAEVVGLILLIACANVANLMLARAASRQREMAIRGALGASGWRIIRQLLVESVLLALLAGIVGLLASALSLRTLASLLPADTPRIADIGLHWNVFLFATVISVFTGLLFGLMPACKMASPHLQQTLRAGGLSVSGRGSQFRPFMLLVMGQIGLSVIVITAAGLMLHSLHALNQVNPGFRTDHIMTAEVSLDADACKQPGYCQSFFRTLVEQLHGAADVENAALIDALPMTGRDLNYVYDAEGHPRTPQEGARLATGATVSSDYFNLVGLKLLRGRLLNDADQSGASRAVVINQRMADDLWPNQDPIGKRIMQPGEEKQPALFDPDIASIIVGVVSNTHHASLSSGIEEEVYLPIIPKHEHPVMTVMLRTRTTPPQAAAELRRIVGAFNPRVPVTHIRTLDEVVASSESASRSLAILLLGLAVLAVGVGSVGVYSLIAFMVSWRTREIGIRLALGEPRQQIVRAIIKQSLMLATVGCAAGLLCAVLCTGLLQRFLFEIKPFDPLTFCVVPLLMLVLAAVAAWVPARRAASVDPIQALRSE